MTTGEEIKYWRKKKGLTQQQLADKLGIAATGIRQYELGKRNPKLDTLEKIADALGIEVSNFSLVRDYLPSEFRAWFDLSALGKDNATMIQTLNPWLEKHDYHIDASEAHNGTLILIHGWADRKTKGWQSRELTEQDLDSLKQVTDNAIQNWLASFGAPFNQ
ncbi:helix-turn-helix domain-containing protein [Schleiferilactobacillus perolens]|jgi:transcriptional regulator with XRE-family HTH domain|uniref:helix-turn-helix domain-containing protein n=1 Tax=Schleiferilactobacillus perolens TaxID=100468 RepID=UPI002352FC4A|nr:helix-turn-helix transcriptional regulator [Schleiferilactobacillus perolens]MCI2170990.1 helix-turn-helix domain-containing protein [Schleiferilactobacillus perolens]